MSSDEERILQIFGGNEVPEVSNDSLKLYLDYIKKNIVCPCALTGIESIGYFSWEERYEFGYGDKKEYKKMRKANGSYKDKYKLKIFNGKVEGDWDILVRVNRILDSKSFEIPLSELKTTKKDDASYQLLSDYTVWLVNW